MSSGSAMTEVSPPQVEASTEGTSLLARYGGSSLERVRRALDELRAGRCVVLVDDEDRENEGDLVFAAEHASPALINFMAREGRGLICLTMTDEHLKRLDLPLMVKQNQSGFGTAFTVSIEARDGVSTGISAADRARTIQVAIDERTRPDDLVRPGHVFPLRAQPGGVLVRTGQTEGSVDLARLAGLKPAGVICEILNDDGSMARLPDLVSFAERHGLIICSVADIIAYRLEHESLVEKAAEAMLDTPFGQLRAIAFRSTVDDQEALAIVKGSDEALRTAAAGASEHLPLVRVHSGDPLTDVFGGILDQGGLMLRGALRQVAAADVGVILYLPKAPEPLRFVDAVKAVEENRQAGKGLPARDRAPKGASPVVRHYGTGAQILRSLGLTRIRLLSNNPIQLTASKGFGIEISDRVPITLEA